MVFSSLMMIIFMLIMTSLCCALLTDHYVSFLSGFWKISTSQNVCTRLYLYIVLQRLRRCCQRVCREVRLCYSIKDDCLSLTNTVNLVVQIFAQRVFSHFRFYSKLAMASFGIFLCSCWLL